ncbi:MAG: hypothetical protein WCK11_05485 [Candidatus Falkowbacteria bacterium]
MNKIIFSLLLAVALFATHSVSAMSLIKVPEDEIYTNTAVAWDFNFADLAEKDTIIPTDATSWQMVVTDTNGQVVSQSNALGASDTEAYITTANYPNGSVYALVIEWLGANAGSYQVGTFTPVIPGSAFSAGRFPYQSSYSAEQPIGFMITFMSVEDIYYLFRLSSNYANIDQLVSYQLAIKQINSQMVYSEAYSANPANPNLNVQAIFNSAPASEYTGVYLIGTFASGQQMMAQLESTPFTIVPTASANATTNEVASTTDLVVSTLKDNLLGTVYLALPAIVILALLIWLIVWLYHYIIRFLH